MGQIAPITVYDGADPPELHLLSPVSVTRNGSKVEALWRETLTDVPLDACVSVVATLALLPSGVYKAESRVEVPVMESISGQNAAGYTAAPKVAYVDTVVTTGFFHKRSTVDGRRLVRQLAINLDGSVSTSVTPVTTGPIPQLFDQLIAPT